MASPMAFMTAAPLVRGAAASRARSVGVSPRRASALPARAARRSPAAGVSMVGGSLNDLLANNLEWSKHMTADDPNYFQNLVAMQQPDYLWIGCTFCKWIEWLFVARLFAIAAMAPGRLWLA